MLDAFLAVAYQQEQQKTASQTLAGKLMSFPMEDLVALAQGDTTSKLAYIGEPCETGEPKTWLDKYRGSPLFEKAVALEKQLLEADAAAEAKRDEERESDRAMEGTRDALRMQKRMLDLDLALAQEGIEDPEAKEEQGAQLIEQAQAQEAAAGKGNEPHEKAETAALQQFRQAQGQEAAAEQPAKPAGTTVEVKSASLLSKFREVGKLASAVETLVPEARSTRGTIHPERAQGAGAGEYTPSDTASSLQVDKTAAREASRVAHVMRFYTDPAYRAECEKTAGVMEALKTPIAGTKDWFIRTGKSGLKGAGTVSKAAPAAARRASVIPPRASGTFARGGVVSIGDDELRRLGFGDLAKRASMGKDAISHTRIIDAVKRAPASRLEGAFEHGVRALGKVRKGSVVDQADTLAQAAATRLSGGDWQAELRGLDRLRKAASSIVGGKAPIDPHALYQEVLQEYPDFAPKPSPSKRKTAGLGAIVQGAKALGSGAKSLATTAHAAGGLPQVARSFGNVGAGLAKAHPLATAGLAAGAAGLGGMALGRATAPSGR